MATKFFTNHKGKTLLQKLEGIFQHTDVYYFDFMEGIRTGKIRVKAHPSKKLHAKIYIFRQQNEHEHAGWGSVITGSSNLTEPGLERNFEFNVELRDHDDVKFALETFEDLWKEGIDLNPDFIEKLKRKTYLNDEFTPFEIYIKFLIEYFGRSIEYDPDIANGLPKKYTSLRYQVDAVKQGVEMLKRHNGFFLADVVGLGKTVVAAMIMKHFYHINGWKTRVLVVYPPALKNAWRNTLELIQSVWNEIPEWQDGIEIPDGIFRKTVANYDEVVVRELLANALVHRPYTIRGDLFINLYNDRMEVHNPGLLPLGVTPQNILHKSVMRNPHLARVFYDLGLMEREGSGYDRMYEILLSAGKPLPKAHEGNDRVKVVVEKRIVRREIINFMDKVRQEVNVLKSKELITLGLLAQHQALTAIELPALWVCGRTTTSKTGWTN
ncbi:MAG: hypothetical protein K9J37_20690 [Saprospiraceae bacterium]|nr:hypothetical protein [Saprospiraceae bacterium]MCF8252338.1 hypothetical protein [Saprospiraceae bacterium]MCF8282309.1 hypothetical protein [Bacteroidales bacterium]MCF8313771.1 hypothetical protein [Saprospiraceae bacterium]MCF8442477.1 hypothetical protein [Saprospiraceae bacterium]